ncbi:hypothetical protein BCON_0523g00050 [Botryotinia convoluta]|uniref:BTB domain-containing protein n=1 Tax=Botryotinia convoluta TaxID=54673 RepID=A0A4Z1H5P7_9HELO|nr:hypothetical protein BCON_0523g00050 [Botryotinia convoluta]
MNTADRARNTYLLGPAMFRQLVLRSSKKSINPHGNVEQQLAEDQSDCDHDLEDDMVSIQVGVGPKATDFNVPKGPLCRKVPFFNAMFNHGWLESTTKSCALQDDDPETFSILLHWVFDVPHETSVMFTVKGLHNRSETFMKLAILADKYLIGDLPELIEERLIQKDLTRLNDPCYELPKTSWYRLAWELLPRASILRKYFGPQNKPGYKFVYLNGILVEPETLQVKSEMLKEWKEIFAGRKNISEEIQKFRTFPYVRDRHSSSRVCPSPSWRFREMHDFLDFVFCSTIMLDEEILRYFWLPERRMSQSAFWVGGAYRPMHIHR